jgi:hypothetical protein
VDTRASRRAHAARSAALNSCAHRRKRESFSTNSLDRYEALTANVGLRRTRTPKHRAAIGYRDKDVRERYGHGHDMHGRVYIGHVYTYTTCIHVRTCTHCPQDLERRLVVTVRHVQADSGAHQAPWYRCAALQQRRLALTDTPAHDRDDCALDAVRALRRVVRSSRVMPPVVDVPRLAPHHSSDRGNLERMSCPPLS